MASTLIGRIIENNGKEIGYILDAHYGTISFQHLGNFAFVATLSDGTNVTIMTSPVDDDGKQIRVEAVYDPFTMPMYQEKEVKTMSRFPPMPYGYLIEQGFVGILPDGRKMLFPTQDEYIEYLSVLNESAA